MRGQRPAALNIQRNTENNNLPTPQLPSLAPTSSTGTPLGGGQKPRFPPILSKSISNLSKPTTPVISKPPSILDLPWSDDESDEKKEIEKYKLPVVKIIRSEEEKNKLLIQRQEMLEEPFITSPDRKEDHKRSFFSGNIRTKEKIQKEIEVKLNQLKQEEKRLKNSKEDSWAVTEVPSSSSKGRNTAISSSTSSFPYVSQEFRNYFDDNFLSQLWERISLANLSNQEDQPQNIASSSSSNLGLIPINKILFSQVLKWIDSQTSENHAKQVYRTILDSYEVNDFIEFSNFLEFLIPFYLKELKFISGEIVTNSQDY